MRYICWIAVTLIALFQGYQPTAQAQAQLDAPSAVFLPLVVSPPATGQTAEQYQFAQQVLALVNNERAKAGCAPLTMNTRLVVAAQRQSQDMALNDFFSHTNPDASLATVGLRASAAGYVWSRVAENIAAGYTTPGAVMGGWMSSGGHRTNILNCAYTEIGIGYFYQGNDQPLPGSSWPLYHYWTQVFGRP